MIETPSEATSSTMLSWGATVTHIVDGDTFDVTWDNGYTPPNGLSNRIRISGVDTNETTLNESFAQEAKTRLAELLPVGSHVTLKAEHEGSNTLNRPVRHVFLGSTNIGEQMVSEGLGLAVSYDMEPGYRADYFAASEKAQINEVGMWEPGASGGDPSTWPDITMVVNYDAQGDDAANLNDEYVLIRNDGTTTLDLSGWSLRSSARLNGTTIKIPDGIELDPGETYKIHVGSGANTSSDQYLGDTQPLFDNTGDVVYVRDTFLNIRATQLWPATLTRGTEHSIVIDDVQYDAPGDDAVNPNGEWVKIRNAGAVDVDLTNWRLKDDGFDYAFKDNETLSPGEVLTIHVGKGVDSGSVRYWGHTTGILNNVSQSLHIWTPQSLNVDDYAWGTEKALNEDPRGAIRMFANFDAAGNDATNPNGEWVSLWNTSDSSINIGGYKLKSDGDVFVFASNTRIEANQNILVKVGTGTATSGIKFWGKDSGIFTNSGDSVDLIDKSGDTLLRHAWPISSANTVDYGIVIDAVNFDAPGNDSKNPNGEWIRLRNSSLSEQNLRNWQLNVGPYQLNLLADREIAPGETITVHMGSGKNTDDTVYWGKSSGILANDGTYAVKLLAPDRDLIEYHGWGKAGSATNQSVSAAIEMSINYDAEGDDATNPKGEWINILNTSSSKISLNGYHLYTDGTTYKFDSGDTLKAGERMRIYRGAGTDSGLVRYANLNEFANDGDEIEFRSNFYGGNADLFSYPSTGLKLTQGQFDIVGVNADAAGNDATNPNGEWIDIKNTGSTTSNLRDWRIQYGIGTFYDFNANFMLAAGHTVRLYIGSGVNTSTSLYWGKSAGFLNNATGQVVLQDFYRGQADKFTW
jgi:endonuclease YncB( thermonuclease family)